jgi:hypothetical protein
MPKLHTFPALFEDLKSISTSFLNSHGYFRPNQKIAGTLSWHKEGTETGRITVAVNMVANEPFVELDYVYDQKRVNYRVKLKQIRSNLGKGFIWYFECPFTLKRCNKLYLGDTYFLHRSAFAGCMYEKQTHSKQNRELIRLFNRFFSTDKLYEELNKKHAKKTYRGKPTKKYLKITRQIQRAENITSHQLERLLG